MLRTSMVECTLTGQRFCELDMDERLLFLWQQTSFWVIPRFRKRIKYRSDASAWPCARLRMRGYRGLSMRRTY